MLNQTQTKLKTLRLGGMLRAWEAMRQVGTYKSLGFDEILDRLVDAEVDERHEKKVGRNLKRSRLRSGATLADIDAGGERGIDRTFLARLAEGEWLRKAENILITGATGTGKTFLAEAIAHRACMLEYRPIAFTCTKFFRFLKESQADHSFGRRMKFIARHSLLVLDDFGLEPFSEENRRWLLEVIDDRIGNGSLIFVSQLPSSLWKDVIGDPTFADAILDRVIHNAHKIELAKEAFSRRSAKPLS
jgi:DNA replication protein DnaC